MKQLMVMAVMLALCNCDESVPAGGVDGAGEAPDAADADPPADDPDAPRAERPGTWSQPFALPGQISTLTIEPDPEVEPSSGSYALYRSCGVPNCVAEAGTYHAVPENPAVG